MRRLMLRPLLCVVLSVGVAACSTTPAPINESSPTPVAVVASAAPATSPSAEPLGSPALPRAGRILVVIEGGGQSRPAYLDVTGLHVIPTALDTTFAQAVWASPSRDSIIFDSERDLRRHIFRMGLDGGDVVELTSGDAIQEHPAISPDGSMIAYGMFVDALNGADLGIHLANADGTRARAITTGGQADGNSGDTSPSFSPDGTSIVFERAVDLAAGKSGLFIIRTDGTGLRRLTDDSLGAGYPRWSPDGKRILFSQHLDAATFVRGALWVVDVGGGAPRSVTDPKDPGWSFEGDWSPDGLRIVFNYFVPGAAKTELRVVNADGTHVSMSWSLPEGYGANTPDWGP
jgi:Tol biopolymer transport system component